MLLCCLYNIYNLYAVGQKQSKMMTTMMIESEDIEECDLGDDTIGCTGLVICRTSS